MNVSPWNNLGLIIGLGGMCLLPRHLPASDVNNLMKVDVKPREIEVSQEVTADYGCVGGARTHSGSLNFGDVSEQNGSYRHVLSTQVEQGILLRLGAGWRRFSFGLPVSAPLPNTLQVAHLVLGADFELSDQWLMRVETEPGFYSDFHDMNGETLNAPSIIGFSYLVDQNLQWFFGLSADFRREIPVLPGGGVRWKFADQWTLMFLLPKPKLEYAANEAVTLYLGGEIKGGTYKLARDFGDTHGRPNFNRATLDYTEFRVGGGLAWKIGPALTLELEGGWLIGREFDFYTADVEIDSDGAPYGQLALTAGF